MTITVKLFATLRNKRFQVSSGEYPPGATVRDIVHSLGIPEEDIALILVNGSPAERGQSLGDGDTVALFPPVTGG